MYHTYSIHHCTTFARSIYSMFPYHTSLSDIAQALDLPIVCVHLMDFRQTHLNICTYLAVCVLPSFPAFIHRFPWAEFVVGSGSDVVGAAEAGLGFEARLGEEVGEVGATNSTGYRRTHSRQTQTGRRERPRHGHGCRHLGSHGRTGLKTSSARIEC